ncbi:MAG: sulfotransferase [Litoreibacter sp.]
MAPIDAKQITSVFQQARDAQTKGEFEAARAHYVSILEVRPNLPEVYFNLAQIAEAEGKHKDAMIAFARAADLKPAEPAIWSTWIDAAKTASDKKALANIKRALTRARIPQPVLGQMMTLIQGGSAKTGRDALLALMSKRKFREAEAMALRLYKAKPKEAFAAMMLGAARAELGKPEAAQKAFQKAVQLDKSSSEAHGRLGAFLVNAGRADEGVKFLRKAAKLAPKSGLAQLNLGWACFHAGDIDVAGEAFENARALGDDTASVWAGLGRVALARKDDRAVEYFENSNARGGPSVERHMLYASALRAARRDTDALAAYDAALAMTPHSPAIMAEKAMMLQNLGDPKAARDLLKQALEREPENGSLFLLYVSTGRIPDNDLVAIKARALFENGSKDRHLMFAIAKLNESAGVSPFPALIQGNKLSRDIFPYDFSNDQLQAQKIRTAYMERDVSAWEACGDPKAMPIFVTGLPRSGTTLIEQIIAAHPDVASAGEVGILGRALGELNSPPDRDDLAARYWGMLRSRFPGATRITDKSISTFNHIGFVKLIFPNAKIVVVERDPRDTAISLYKNMFGDGLHRYSNDLGDIARFTTLFEEQIAFWLEMAPDSFTRVKYEDFISDPEMASRQVIESVGLEWHDACLSFYDSGARVDTLSNVQVRQPIYGSSMGAWRKHEEALEPFFKIYGKID